MKANVPVNSFCWLLFICSVSLPFPGTSLLEQDWTRLPLVFHHFFGAALFQALHWTLGKTLVQLLRKILNYVCPVSHLFFWQLLGHIADEITRCLARSWNEITEDPKGDERKSLIKCWHDKGVTSHEDVEGLTGQDITDQNPAGVGGFNSCRYSTDWREEVRLHRHVRLFFRRTRPCILHCLQQPPHQTNSIFTKIKFKDRKIKKKEN